jgi:hypothetical protein
MKAALVILASAAALTLVGQAQAKGLKIVGVCGAAGCRTIEHRLTDWGSKTASYTRPSRYYVLRIGFEGPAGLVRRAYWLPESGWFALAEWSQGCWYADCWRGVGRQAQAALTRASAGLEPFTPHLAEVTVDGERVANPDTYLPLLETCAGRFFRLRGST